MSGLNSTDICKIIKECGKSGVKHFCFGELEFILDGQPTVLTQPSKIFEKSPVNVENQMEMFNNSKDTVNEEEPLDLDELQLSDPLEYEKIMSGVEG